MAYSKKLGTWLGENRPDTGLEVNDLGDLLKELGFQVEERPSVRHHPFGRRTQSQHVLVREEWKPLSNLDLTVRVYPNVEPGQAVEWRFYAYVASQDLTEAQLSKLGFSNYTQEPPEEIVSLPIPTWVVGHSSDGDYAYINSVLNFKSEAEEAKKEFLALLNS